MIVNSIVDLGHNLGLTIVAEGVESADVLATLKECKCDVAQGYFLSRPISAADFEIWYRERRAFNGESASDTAGRPPLPRRPT